MTGAGDVDDDGGVGAEDGGGGHQGEVALGAARAGVPETHFVLLSHEYGGTYYNIYVPCFSF